MHRSADTTKQGIIFGSNQQRVKARLSLLPCVAPRVDETSAINIMANYSPIPPLISIPRIRTLVASLLVSVGSGTNYVSNLVLFVDMDPISFTRSSQVRSAFDLAAFVAGEHREDDLFTFSISLCA